MPTVDLNSHVRDATYGEAANTGPDLGSGSCGHGVIGHKVRDRTKLSGGYHVRDTKIPR